LSSCSGKTALVTDASQGAGRAAALALAKAGAQVLVHHHRKAARAEAVVEEIRAVGAPISASIANLVNHFAPLLGPRGIRVNAIAPIVNDSGAAAFAKAPERRVPRRSARLQDLGATITFLASNEASRITGETLRIGSRFRLQGDLR
jgi:NAD(P)-dependent dehydrogenase (short-subunit alcohol dehydrogenase family)